ncbi:unnamed protein product [Chrysoparadoxa australica]
MWIIDVEASINRMYASFRLKRATLNYVEAPYFTSEGGTGKQARRTRKRKRRELRDGKATSQTLPLVLEQLPLKLQELDQLRQAIVGQERNLKGGEEGNTTRTDEGTAGIEKRRDGAEDDAGKLLREWAHSSKSEASLTSKVEQEVLHANVLVHNEVERLAQGPPGFKAILPKQSSYLLGDLLGENCEATYRQLASYGPYNLITMDPPWHNRSVSRSRQYETSPTSHMVAIPIKELSAESCHLLIWVTNDPDVIEQAMALISGWGFQLKARWHWLKCTTGGEFVTPLTSQHKKPYELLLVACKGEGQENIQSSNGCSRAKGFASTPLRHSWKPPLEDLLPLLLAKGAPSVAKELGEEARPGGSGELHGLQLGKKLELFAREVRTGWVCCGDEVLKFQRDIYWDQRK